MARTPPALSRELQTAGAGCVVSALASAQRLSLHVLLLGSRGFISVNCPRLESGVVVTRMHVSALCEESSDLPQAAFASGVFGRWSLLEVCGQAEEQVTSCHRTHPPFHLLQPWCLAFFPPSHRACGFWVDAEFVGSLGDLRASGETS